MTTLSEPRLFDMPADWLPVRSCDPETSKAAARQLNVRARQAEVLHALRHASVSSTAEQIRDSLARYGLHREKGEVRSRLAELADVRRFDPPLVRKVGTRRASTGLNVTTWGLTAAGKAAARELDQ